jgi:hypothetical protein
LAADWDITNEIVSSLQQLQTSPDLVHVKGHQDDHVPYRSLPLNAQPNVDVDVEAGYYQCMFPGQRPLIPRLPSNHAQLTISGNIVCAKLKPSILEAFTVPPYLEKRFQWAPVIPETIDWTAYTQTIGRFCTQHIQITTLCNDLLPTAHSWANWYNTPTTEHCLHCGEIEDRDHILQCTFAPHHK